MRIYMPEFFLAFMLLAQLLSLIPEKKWCRDGLNSIIFLFGMAFVFFASLFEQRGEANELFRLPSAAISLVALMTGCYILASKVLIPKRKPEMLFMISVLCLFGRVVFLSQNYLLSLLCILGMGIAGIFLTALSFRSANEGEATLKWWFQLSIVVILGFAGVLFLLLLAGNLEYSAIALAIQSLPKPYAFCVTLLYLLPFLILAGLFPWHFLVIDRDHGAPWGAQAVCSILISGVASLAMLKAGVAIYRDNEIGHLPMQILESLAVITAFWCSIGAYTQTNAKRFLAYFSSSQWAAILLVCAHPSAISLSASIYYFLGLSLSLSLLYAMLALLHEHVGSDDMHAIYGVGLQQRAVGVILLAGLCFFLFVPPFMGFSALFHIFAALFECQSIWRVLDFLLLQLAYVFIAVHLMANIFFRKPEQAVKNNNALRLSPYAKLNFLVGAVIVFVLLLGGILGDQIFVSLEAAVKNFII